MNRHNESWRLRSSCAAAGAGAVWLVATAAVTSPAEAQPFKHEIGEWVHRPTHHDWDEEPEAFVPQFAAHLPNGKILLWLRTGGESDCSHVPGPLERVWDPVSGNFDDVSSEVTEHASCSGYAPLANGDIVSVGGRWCPDEPPPGETPSSDQATLFLWDPEPSEEPWQSLTPMIKRRFYPSAVTLNTSKILVMFGVNPPAVATSWVEPPEIYNPATDEWTLVQDTQQQPPQDALHPDVSSGWTQYPHCYQIQDGRVFHAGPDGQNTWILDLTTAQWEEDALSHPANFASNPGTVMYEPGKILKSGGYSTSDHGMTDFIDFTGEQQQEPAWAPIAADDEDLMQFPRRRHYLIMMPDGKIMAALGYQGPDPNQVNVAHAEWVDPENFELGWRPLAEQTYYQRGIGPHTLGLLLRDGTVMVAGGETGANDSHKAEIFEPPYLFDENDSPAARPIIDDAPEEVEYGQSFTITLGSQGVQEIERVSLVRLGAPTHNFDQNQRFMWLQPADPEVEFIDQTQGELEIRAPSTRTHAPPGYYMLFVLTPPDSVTGHRTPSEGHYIRLFTPCSPYDLNDDGTVNGEDLGILLANWGSCPEPPEECPSDFNGDGEVDGLDLGILLANWGLCEGSSSSSMSGGGESTAMAGGSTIDYDWILGADTIADLQEMEIEHLWAWYLTMVAQSGAASE